MVKIYTEEFKVEEFNIDSMTGRTARCLGQNKSKSLPPTC